MDPTVEAALIGAAAALIGVGGTVVVAVTSARSTRRTNQATIDAAHADALLTLEATREAQFADRYSRALEQVGSDNPDVRIGGIYALEGIALDSPRHHPTVMEVLSAFIRGHSRARTDGDSPERRPPSDVQAALTVVGRRKTENDIRPMDLVGADLHGADLTGAHLTDAILTSVDLTRARLTDAVLAGVNLRHANLHGAGLTRADLTRAHLQYADLNNANLYGADLTGAILADRVYPGYPGQGSDGDGVPVGGADFHGAVLTGAILTDVDVSDSDLTSARWPQSLPTPQGWKRRDDGGLIREAGRQA